MYTLTMDFDRGEMRIPKDVAQALSMPSDFGWFVHRGDRQIAITQNLGYVPRNSQIDRYWRETVGAYCIAVKNGMQQAIGNLISGFNGSGVYIMTGNLEHAFGELAVVFDLAHAAAVTNVEKEEDNVSAAAPEFLCGYVKTHEDGAMPKQNPCKWCGNELPPSRTKTIHSYNSHCDTAYGGTPIARNEKRITVPVRPAERILQFTQKSSKSIVHLHAFMQREEENRYVQDDYGF